MAFTQVTDKNRYFYEPLRVATDRTRQRPLAARQKLPGAVGLRCVADLS
jgi:hypothetical protein